MTEAVIVAYARTGFAKSHRGSFNRTHGSDMGAHVAKAAVERAGIDPEMIEESIWGCAYPEGATGGNIARQIVARAGFPDSIPGATINRFCSSGLQAIVSASHQIRCEGVEVAVAGGLESLSLVQPPRNTHSDWLEQNRPDLYLPMIETSDIVAERYAVSRERQDEYGYMSQMRTAAAQTSGIMDDEIVPMETVMAVRNKETGEETLQTVTVDRDECNRPSTTLEALAKLEPVRAPGMTTTAGNASQLSDGAAAVVVMSRKRAEQEGIAPLAMVRGFAVSGLAPDEMGIGPVLAIPKLLKRHGLSVADIDLWELNEAFASQCVYCRDELGIDPDKYNVNGGAISIGHPFGASGARMAGHITLEGRRRGVRYGVVTMCIGGGQGAAALLEFA